ncbi:hypothetical protein H9P43_003433 [Blastocladiella emersonii ATCC 22665]|nr:hypothetical protein H9P43_003433 [Blastocladiella emersonii ATCC 22665]
MNASLLLLLVVVFATLSTAQKAESPTGAQFSCTKLDAKTDPTCALFPFESALPAGQTEGFIKKMGLTALLCPTLPPKTIGLFLCFTPLGNCNGLPWPLPKDENDLPGVVNMYNTVNLAEFVPVAKAKGFPDKVLCYDECKASIDFIKSCPAAFKGVKPDADPCAGLPTTNCISAKDLNATTTATAATTAAAPAATAAAKPTNSGAGASAAGSLGVAAAAVAIAAAAL